MGEWWIVGAILAFFWGIATIKIFSYYISSKKCKHLRIVEKKGSARYISTGEDCIIIHRKCPDCKLEEAYYCLQRNIRHSLSPEWAEAYIDGKVSLLTEKRVGKDTK